MIRNGVVIGAVTFKDVLGELVRLGLQAGSPEGIALVQSYGLDADWLRPKSETLELNRMSDTSVGMNDGIPPRFLEAY